MISVQIEDHKIELGEMSDQWVIESIERRRRNGNVNICVQVIIDEPDCHIAFNKNCVSTGPAKKAFSKKEKEIARLWENHHLVINFDIGEFLAFLKELRRYF